MSAADTCQPCEVRCFVSARPMPEEAPVTIATGGAMMNRMRLGMHSNQGKVAKSLPTVVAIPYYLVLGLRLTVDLHEVVLRGEEGRRRQWSRRGHVPQSAAPPHGYVRLSELENNYIFQQALHRQSIEA